MVTIKEAANMLGCSGSQVYKLITAGLLKGHRQGRRIYIKIVDIDNYSATHMRNGKLDFSVTYGRFISANPDFINEGDIENGNK